MQSDGYTKGSELPTYLGTVCCLTRCHNQGARVRASMRHTRRDDRFSWAARCVWATGHEIVNYGAARVGRYLRYVAGAKVMEAIGLRCQGP